MRAKLVLACAHASLVTTATRHSPKWFPFPHRGACGPTAPSDAKMNISRSHAFNFRGTNDPQMLSLSMKVRLERLKHALKHRTIAH